jgi:hypothetical protein
MPMNPERKALWLEALRSGEYTQGKSQLKREVAPDAANHCCLGVACELYKRETGEGAWVRSGEELEFEISRDDYSWSSLPGAVAEWFGLDRDPYVYEGLKRISLANLNDEGKSFEEIADVIEQEL